MANYGWARGQVVKRARKRSRARDVILLAGAYMRPFLRGDFSYVDGAAPSSSPVPSSCPVRCRAIRIVFIYACAATGAAVQWKLSGYARREKL